MSTPFSLAIIPARGGSKRIPRKNIRPFAGKPIISYSIAAAQNSKCFSDIIVSTDDDEIAGVARHSGANVPFLRSQATSDDCTGIAEVVKEVVTEFESWAKRRVDWICCILPTAPFVTAENIREGLRQLSNNEVDAVVSVVRYSYPIQRALRIDGGCVSMISPENYEKRSQELEPTYHDAGQLYWIRKEKLFEYGKMFIPRTGYILIDQLRAQDIDTEEDWTAAEVKYAMLSSAGGL